MIAAIAAVLFVFCWLLRFNDPGGSFAGLTDDHFFYLVRGWQILFGDLPVRDFVDHGAPLYYYVGAAVQWLGGRGTVSELAFSAAALSLSASLTFWLCTTASGSILAGLVGAAFHILLEPRFYNYPKVLVYAVALPLLWRFSATPTYAGAAWLALVTVIGFLFRHDHGVFVALAMGTLLLGLQGVPWRDRFRHGAVYGAFVVALLAPYLAFIEWNGGVASYFAQASAWAERDRDRAPIVWPGLFANPDGVTEAAEAAPGLEMAVAVVRDNLVAWTFYAELALPLVALALVLASRDGFRPRWPQARANIAMVAVLGFALDAFFLRSPLAARLADPSVPLAVLVSWLLVAVPRLFVDRNGLRTGMNALVWPIRLAALATVLPLAFVFASGMTWDFHRRLDKAGLTERFGKGFERASGIVRQLEQDWNLASWADRADRPDLIGLSMYVNACTEPSDRVLVQAYMPQVLALARRAFAGGHADLRPGFFKSEDAQRLTIARLEQRPVPIILLEAGDSLANFRESFPLVIGYIDRHYREVGSKVFDGRFGTTLFVRRDRMPSGTYAPYEWPCYGPGVVRS